MTNDTSICHRLIVSRRSWNDLISQVPSTSTTSSSSTETSPNQIQRKPMRIVKAVQRSPPSINENRPLTGPKTYSLAKPGLFSASPLNSIQKQQINAKNLTTHFSTREENDVQSHLKEFASRYPNHHQFKELARLTRTNEHRLSSDYTRCLFPIVDRSKRRNFQENSDENKHLSIKTSTHPAIECHITRTVSNETNIFDDQSLRQAVRFFFERFSTREKKQKKKKKIFVSFFLSGRTSKSFEKTFRCVERKSTFYQRRN